MKKLLLIMLLTSTSMAYADEGKYTMISASQYNHTIWVLDSERGKIKLCHKYGKFDKDQKIYCNNWKDLNVDED